MAATCARRRRASRAQLCPLVHLAESPEPALQGPSVTPETLNLPAEELEPLLGHPDRHERLPSGAGRSPAGDFTPRVKGRRVNSGLSLNGGRFGGRGSTGGNDLSIHLGKD